MVTRKYSVGTRDSTANVFYVIKGEFLCHREEEVQVQGVRAAEAARAAEAVRPTDGAVRLTAALFVGRTVAGVHRCLLREESGAISLREFRCI